MRKSRQLWYGAGGGVANDSDADAGADIVVDASVVVDAGADVVVDDNAPEDTCFEEEESDEEEVAEDDGAVCVAKVVEIGSAVAGAVAAAAAITQPMTLLLSPAGIVAAMANGFKEGTAPSIMTCRSSFG